MLEMPEAATLARQMQALPAPGAVPKFKRSLTWLEPATSARVARNKVF